MAWCIEKNDLGRKLSRLFYDYGFIKTWYKNKPTGWTLVSGIWSPIYIQLRPICSCRESRNLLELVGTAISGIIQNETPHVNKILGVAFAGIPISIATTMISGIPSCYTRKTNLEGQESREAKILGYGEHNLVEGDIEDGDVIAIIDDVVTHFDSKLEARSQLQREIQRRQLRGNIACDDVIVLVDREQGAGERALQLGMRLHSLIPLRSKAIDWLKDRMSEIEYEMIKQYLDNPTSFQDEKTKLKLLKLANKAIVEQK